MGHHLVVVGEMGGNSGVDFKCSFLESQKVTKSCEGTIDELLFGDRYHYPILTDHQ